MRRNTRKTILVVTTCFGLCFSTSYAHPDVERLDDRYFRELIKIALAALPNLLCENDKPCAPASQEELEVPPITIAEARQIATYGTMSGAAAYCGLDWEEVSYSPMMNHWRTESHKSERQMAIIAVIHGVSQGRAQEALKSQGPCTADFRAQMKRYFSPDPE